MFTLRCALVSITASFLAAGSLRAGMLTVTNNSFELSTGYNGGNPSTVPGWTAPPGQATYGQVPNVSSFFTSGLSGNNAIFVGGQITQAISATFQTGATYTLTVDVGNPNNTVSDNAGFVFGFRNTANSDFIQGGGFLFVGSSDITPIPDGTFKTFSFTYTAAAADNGNAIQIGLDDFYYGGVTNNSDPSFYLDNVTLSTSVVPEPSTYVGGFFCLSILAIASTRRSFQRRA